jgi:ferredoxin, 2Fe-2S
MTVATFTSRGGFKWTVEAPVGWSLMEIARKAGIEGILAECGGAGACATCHVQVTEPWASEIPSPSADEQDMLGCTAVPASTNSRLSCQIRMTETLDGIELLLPESQV